jgi:osmoprotectant transport system permease protein
MLDFAIERLPDLWSRSVEHVVLAAVSTGAAVALGVPLGIAISRNSTLRGPVLGVASALQTIPSLALLAFLLPLMGIGTRPAIVALILYALLPIVRNTYAGITGVPAAVIEAARGVGFTPRQQLWMVEIPLALPVLVAGIRTAAVIGVGIATLAAAIGAGGLGDFIFRGLALNNSRLVLLGAVPAALLALAIDAAIGVVQARLSPRHRTTRHALRRWAGPVLAGAALLLAALALPLAREESAEARGRVVVGAKNFTEQYLLGQLMAQLIAARTNLRVERRFGLGGTLVCHGALEAGEIDLYAEYTGTALTAILKREGISDPETTAAVVAALYEEKHDLEWLPAFGFNNTYALTVRATDADRRGWQTISDLKGEAASLRAGFTSEFAERPDGYPGLREAYGFGFGRVSDLDPSLMYQAVANRSVDVIAAFATDGRIAAYQLRPLRDDRGFFPPYHAAPVVRRETLATHPELRKALAPLSGAIDDRTMQRLNYAVDERKRAPAAVAREFLRERGLIGD